MTVDACLRGRITGLVSYLPLVNSYSGSLQRLGVSCVQDKGAISNGYIDGHIARRQLSRAELVFDVVDGLPLKHPSELNFSR